MENSIKNKAMKKIFLVLCVMMSVSSFAQWDFKSGTSYVSPMGSGIHSGILGTTPLLGDVGFPAFVAPPNLDTASVSVTLRYKDWKFAVGKYGVGDNNVSRPRIRALRNAVRAANPANDNTNITINNVNGTIVMAIYDAFLNAPFGQVLAMGSNTAERTFIYTQIRAINNSAIQTAIANSDASGVSAYNALLIDGGDILFEN